MFETVNICVNVINCLIRIWSPATFTPRKNQLRADFDPDDDGNQIKLLLPFVNFFLFVFMFAKILSYMRAFMGMAHMVELTFIAFRTAAGFTYYLFFWVVGFACLYTTIGVSFGFDTYKIDYSYWHDGDYPRMPKAAIMLIASYRNSLNNVAAPSYETRWAKIYDADPNDYGVAQFAIYFIWFVWCVQFYVCAVMLNNFLIAIVSQVFEQVYSSQLQTEYAVKSTFNLETMRYENFLFAQDNRDYFILATARSITEKEQSDWLGIVNAI